MQFDKLYMRFNELNELSHTLLDLVIMMRVRLLLDSVLQILRSSIAFSIYGPRRQGTEHSEDRSQAPGVQRRVQGTILSLLEFPWWAKHTHRSQKHWDEYMDGMLKVSKAYDIAKRKEAESEPEPTAESSLRRLIRRMSSRPSLPRT